MTTPSADPYPLQYDVDYPEQLDRLTTLLRIFWVIPIAIVYALVSGGVSGSMEESRQTTSIVISGGGLLVIPTALMIVFRQKYPRWWFDWNLELSRFGARVGTYVTLLRDEYPSTDEEQAVHLNFSYPDVEADLNRWLPLVKWLLAIPHYVLLFFLVLGAFVAVVIAWFAIVFTGRYPRALFDYVVGVVRWAQRVAAYAFLLITDRYPPFSLR